MIEIANKQFCCGCSACYQKCPKHCIVMIEDENGFLYPHVDTEKCINCKKCEEVCSYLNPKKSICPIAAYAVKNNDESIRLQSSSGGVFYSIAESFIHDGGVVFGSRFDKDWQVVHDCAEDKEDLIAFKGSKYVQSKIGETFIQTESYLKAGRKVLFSGTSCQISALYLFLRKEYDNLFTVEIACHGVPSPKIWRDYLHSLNCSNIGYISHKDKSTGWRNYSLTIKDKIGNVLFTEKGSENKYLLAFSQNLSLRPSCFDCPSKEGKSGSDILLADYWGIEHFVPQMDDGKGTSFVCVNSIKGKYMIENLHLEMKEVDYNESTYYNPCIKTSSIKPSNYSQFWNNYKRKGVKTLFSVKRKRRNFFYKLVKRFF